MSVDENIDDVALEMRSVKKAFDQVIALEGVTFSCRVGEVHGLVGENGAGKSTLMKILAGEYQPDEGDIFINKERVEFKNPRRSKEKGISLIHQEFALVPYLTVVENLFLGKEPCTKLGFIDKAASYRNAKQTRKQLEIDLDLDTPVAELTLAQKQLLEIAKSIQENPRILIMDEPTAALRRHEIDNLFSLIRRIRDQGQTVIFISHRLEEVIEITDRVTVLRNGRVITTVNSSNISKDELIEAVIGRRLDKVFPPKAKCFGPVLININDFIRDRKLKGINLNLRAGEILGLAALEGQGQHMLLRALFGADFCSTKKGSVFYKGNSISLVHPQYPVRSGFGYVPADRQAEGLILGLRVGENISLPGLAKRSWCGFVKCRLENEIVDSNIQALSIKAPSRDTPVRNLSGGNQQKVVLAKWLAADSDILIVDEPTRGVDIGTRAEIYSLMRELADQGKAIILSSRDLDEVLGMSDRVAIIHGGRIVDHFSAGAVSKQFILDMITRVPQDEERKAEIA